MATLTPFPLSPGLIILLIFSQDPASSQHQTAFDDTIYALSSRKLVNIFRIQEQEESSIIC